VKAGADRHSRPSRQCSADAQLATPRVDQERNSHAPKVAAVLERATARRRGVSL